VAPREVTRCEVIGGRCTCHASGLWPRQGAARV